MAKTDKLQIKVTENQKALLQEVAKGEGKTLTKYVLDLIQQDLESKDKYLLLRFLKEV